MEDEKMQLAFNFENEVEIENIKSSNSKPMSGKERDERIARAIERYYKRRENGHTTNRFARND